jgi:hypothetical protein
MRLTSGPALKLNPRNFRSCGCATALFDSFTLSLSLSDEDDDLVHVRQHGCEICWFNHSRSASIGSTGTAAGVAESVIQDIAGWKTAAMFRRYTIRDSRVIKSAIDQAFVQFLSKYRHYTQMYGPPPNCKRFEVGRSSVRVNVSGLLVENYFSGHAMMIRTCRSF